MYNSKILRIEMYDKYKFSIGNRVIDHISKINIRFLYGHHIFVHEFGCDVETTDHAGPLLLQEKLLRIN